MTDKHQLSFLYLGNSEMGAGTENGQAGLVYGHKLLMDVRVYFSVKSKPTFIMTKPIDCDRPFIFTNVYT